MGFFDFLGGGSGADKANRLRTKLAQKYGDPSVRQKAMAQLGQMRIPEAAAVLLTRFTITVEPQTTDADEKDHTFELLAEMGEVAVAPVTDFLKRSEQATAWALRVLEKLLPQAEVTRICVEELTKLGAEYSRDPEKKTVLLHSLEGRTDERIPPVLVPFLEDQSDDVKIAALRLLGPLKYAPAREAILTLLTHAETARRVQVAAVAALEASGLGVQGFRERVEALVAEPYFVDRSGLVQKRT